MEIEKLRPSGPAQMRDDFLESPFDAICVRTRDVFVLKGGTSCFNPHVDCDPAGSHESEGSNRSKAKPFAIIASVARIIGGGLLRSRGGMRRWSLKNC